MGCVPRREGRGDPLSADAQQQLRQSYGRGGRGQRRLGRQHQDLPTEGCEARRAGPQVGHAKTPLRPAKVTPATAADVEWLQRMMHLCVTAVARGTNIKCFSMFTAGRRACVSVFVVQLLCADLC